MEIPKPSYTTFGRITAIAECALGYDNINVVFEFGARYGEDTIEFAKRYPKATIYSFECNENTLVQCKQATSTYSNIVLTPKAISDYDGTITFYPIDKEKTVTTWEDGNQGASSLLKASGKYEVEQYAQKEMQAQCIRLDSFMKEKNISSIDILWMDVQGAELMAFKGLGKRLSDVRVIQCEVEMIEIYNGQPLFHEVKKFLVRHGFRFMGFSSKSKYSGDAIFIHKSCITVDCASLCRWLLVPEISMDNRWGRTKARIRNRGLLYLRKIRHFGSSFKVYKPGFDYGAIVDWQRKVYNPLVGKDVQYRCVVRDKHILDVVIPTTGKDLDVLESCIDSIRKYLKHPIGNVYIVAPKKDAIKCIVNKKRCIFIDETTVLKDISKKDIQYYINGEDRTGWLFQQLLKLSVDTFTKHEYILVMDSDTLLMRPVKYMHKGKIILNTSDEYHETYFKVYKNLMKESPVSAKSFVSHGMLFSKKHLQEMKQFISQRNQTDWTKAILSKVDYSDLSGFSEYETYGNYVLRYHPTEVKLEYWFNHSITRWEEMENLPSYIKTASMHSYNRKDSLD